MLQPIVSVMALLPLAAPARVAEPPVHFRTDVVAVLSRAGCSQGACHGSPQGKNGFRLSLRGYDPDLDYATIVRDQGGRRIDRVNPEASLILLKGTGRTRHQGGARFAPTDPACRVVARWIAEGCRDGGPAGLTRLEVVPPPAAAGQVAARAHFADGTNRNVTALAVFSSSDPEVAPVTPDGKVSFTRTGEAAVPVPSPPQNTSRPRTPP